MKIFVNFLVVAVYLFAITHGAPRGTISGSSGSNENDDVVTVLVVPPGSRKRLANPILDVPDTSDFDIDDTFKSLLTPDISGFNNPFRSNIFDGLFSSMQNALNRFREQMDGFLSHMPEQDFVGLWGKIPEGANTTSTTKIIDGHVVTVNETTYTDSDDKHGMLVRVRIIDVKPQNDTILLTESEADAAAATTFVPSGFPTTIAPSASSVSQEDKSEKEDGKTPSRSIETVEDFDNELPKNQLDALNA